MSLAARYAKRRGRLAIAVAVLLACGGAIRAVAWTAGDRGRERRGAEHPPVALEGEERASRTGEAGRATGGPGLEASTGSPSPVDRPPHPVGADEGVPDPHLPAIFIRTDSGSWTLGESSASVALLSDARAPHVAVVLPRSKPSDSHATGTGAVVSIVSRRGDPLPELVSRRVDDVSGAAASLAGEDREVRTYELAGLSDVPNLASRPLRGWIRLDLDGAQRRAAFEVIFRFSDPGICMVQQGETGRWRVQANAHLHRVSGIRAFSIRLFRGARELAVTFDTVRLGGAPLEDAIRAGTAVDEEEIWAFCDGLEPWAEASDLVAVFDLETTDNHRYTLVWRAAEEGR